MIYRTSSTSLYTGIIHFEKWSVFLVHPLFETERKCQHTVDSLLLVTNNTLVAKEIIMQFYKNVFKTATGVSKDDYETIPYDDKVKEKCFGNYIESFFSARQ